tara:strand:+ start:3710 stop:4306 length:597 start_codon:yes stop_codon:yes gene_type:complete
MYNSNNNELLPSTAQLVKSTIVAFISAIVILITVVLPAEYGIDYTGVGKALGLKQMGEIKMSLAEEVALEKASIEPQVYTNSPTNENSPINPTYRDTMTIKLAPNQGAEVKVKMKEGEKATFNWQSNAGKVNFDIHGDSNPLNIKYYNYDKGSTKSDEGQIIAFFDGYHGWFWRNRSGEDLEVTINVAGEYEYITRIK